MNRSSGLEIISINLPILLLVLGRPSIRSFSQLETGTFERSLLSESGSRAPFLCFGVSEEYSLFELPPFANRLLRGFRPRVLTESPEA